MGDIINLIKLKDLYYSSYVQFGLLIEFLENEGALVAEFLEQF